MNNGFISSLRYKSHLYIIIHNDFLYIGETGSHPAIRWGRHIVKGGTFYENLKYFHDEEIQQDKDIFFCCYELSIVDKEIKSKRRLARMAVETELHKLVCLQPDKFGFESFLTSRYEEYPVRHSFGFAPAAIADKIFDRAAKDFAEWSKQ
ncbi:hypothetical protein [Pseudoalteromonas xiamenensis]